MGAEIPPPDLSFVHAPRRSAHATHNVPTCGVQRGRVGWPQRSAARAAQQQCGSDACVAADPVPSPTRCLLVAAGGGALPPT